MPLSTIGMPRDAPPPATLTLFVCVECGRSFPRKGDCVRHVETHDENAKRYECAWPGCSHSTLQKSNLKTHFLATHMKVRQFQCTIGNCRDIFGDQSSLIRHEKRTHGHYRKHHPYGRTGRKKHVDLDESAYIKAHVPRAPAATPASSAQSAHGMRSPRASTSPVPSLTSGASCPSSTEDMMIENHNISSLKMSKSPALQGFSCDGGPRDPFANPAVFEEFLARIPRLDTLL